MTCRVLPSQTKNWKMMLFVVGAQYNQNKTEYKNTEDYNKKLISSVIESEDDKFSYRKWESELVRNEKDPK